MAKYPTKYKGVVPNPLPGKSLLPILYVLISSVESVVLRFFFMLFKSIALFYFRLNNLPTVEVGVDVKCLLVCIIVSHILLYISCKAG